MSDNLEKFKTTESPGSQAKAFRYLTRRSLDLSRPVLPTSAETKSTGRMSIIKTSKTSITTTKPKSTIGLELPSLEVFIEHKGYNHELNFHSDRISYKYKEIDGSFRELDINNCFQDEAMLGDTSKDFSFEKNGNVMTVDKAAIREFRQKNNYFGALKIIQQPLSESGSLHNVIRLEPIDFKVTCNEDRSVSEHELYTLMNQTPGIIPSCRPPPGNEEQDCTLFCKGEKRFKISNRALAFMKKHLSPDAQFEVKKVEERFRTSDERVGLIPITVVNIGLKRPLRKNSERILAKKDKSRVRRQKADLTNIKKNMLQHSYDFTKNNWSRRGNVYFNEINRVGIRFINELLKECCVDEELSEFSNSFSSSFEGSWDQTDSIPSIAESSFQEGSEDYVDDVWRFLCHLVKNNENLVDFQYDMDGEKWIDIKRIFNIFQVNGESVSDIILKVVLRRVEDHSSLFYYLRCLGRLVKTGQLSSKRDAAVILQCFQSNKYVCIGLDKEKFIYQVDENEAYRKYLKEHAQVSLAPVEGIRASNCKAIVIDCPDAELFKFQRGGKTVCGPLVVCEPCEQLFQKLLEFYDPSLDSSREEDLISPAKQRFGPVLNNGISKKVRKLCTETVFEFISESQSELDSIKRYKLEAGKSPPNGKFLEWNSESSEDERPTLGISLPEFKNMISLTVVAPSKLDKKCNKCGFETSSMLELFSHLSTHFSESWKECTVCHLKVASNLALEEHVCPTENHFTCSLCQRHCPNVDSFFHHMSSHRSSKPFLCAYCDMRNQSFDDYMTHMKIAHQMNTIEEMNFMCNICKAYFYTQDHLLIHRLNNNHIDNASIKCKICYFTCNSIALFHTHILNHSYEQREFFNLAFCLECKLFFFSIFELVYHSSNKHKNPPTQLEGSAGVQSDETVNGFTCKKCLKVFDSINSLQRHLESHCEKQVDETSDNLDPSVTYTLACSVCGMKFMSEYSLNAHMSFHTGDGRASFLVENPLLSHSKRTQFSDCEKQMEKLPQQQIQHQQTQMTSYNQQPFTNQHHTSFPDEQVSSVTSQAHQAIHVPEGTFWDQPDSSTIGITQDWRHL